MTLKKVIVLNDADQQLGEEMTLTEFQLNELSEFLPEGYHAYITEEI